MLANTLSGFDLDSVQTLLNDVALWLTIAVAALFVVYLSLVAVFKKDSFRKSFVSSAIALTGYAFGLLALLFSVKIFEYSEEGYLDTTFWLLFALLVAAVTAIFIGAAIRVAKRKYLKLYTKIAGISLGVYAAAILVYRMILDFQAGDYTLSTQIMLYAFTAALIAVVSVTAFVFGKKRTAPVTKTIAFAGVTIAASFALSYITFFKLGQGGSVTLASLLPVMVFAYVFGMRKGLMVGVIYGFLQFIQAPWFLHPMQFLLDYPIAFSAIVFAGLFKELKIFEKKPVLQFVLGAAIAAVYRYIAHVLSGIFIFGTGDENYSDVAWSFLYNLFVFADMAITAVAGGLLFLSKTFVHQLQLASIEEKKSRNENQTSDSTEKSKFEIENAETPEERALESVEKDASESDKNIN